MIQIQSTVESTMYNIKINYEVGLCFDANTMKYFVQYVLCLDLTSLE